LYLAVFIPDLNLGIYGWSIITGWTTWIFALPIILEIINLNIIQSKGRSKDYELQHEEHANRLEKRTKRNKRIVIFTIFF
jgi:hypothetical protein